MNICCHFLPGLDDDCLTAEEIEGFAHLLAAQGVETCVLAPSFHAVRENPDTFLKRRQEAFYKVQEKLQNRSVHFHQGTLVTFYSGMTASDLTPLRLEGTDLLLLEMPFCHWSKNILDEVRTLSGKHTLILAHVEWYFEDNKPSDSVWSHLAALGVLFQVCISSFLDKKRMKQLEPWFLSNKIHSLASDASAMKAHPALLPETIHWLYRKFDHTEVDAFLKFTETMFIQHQIHPVPAPWEDKPEKDRQKKIQTKRIPSVHPYLVSGSGQLLESDMNMQNLQIKTKQDPAKPGSTSATGTSQNTAAPKKLSRSARRSMKSVNGTQQAAVQAHSQTTVRSSNISSASLQDRTGNTGIQKETGSMQDLKSAGPAVTRNAGNTESGSAVSSQKKQVKTAAANHSALEALRDSRNTNAQTVFRNTAIPAAAPSKPVKQAARAVPKETAKSAPEPIKTEPAAKKQPVPAAPAAESPKKQVLANTPADPKKTAKTSPEAESAKRTDNKNVSVPDEDEELVLRESALLRKLLFSE